jgi:CubicO group peptidase (beta-lactamase class C family)
MGIKSKHMRRNTIMKYARLPRYPASRTASWSVLIPGLLLICLVSTGCTAGEVDLEDRIQRFESGLLPGPGIVIQGRAWPRAPLPERMQAYRVPGVSIAVFRDFEIEWARGYGLQSAEGDDPVTPQTLFQAASISKPVAAAAALSLVQEGLLDLDEDINGWLRSWKLPENEFTAEKKVTLRGILSHTAGLTVHGFPGYARDKDVPSLLQVLDGEKPANTAPIRVDTAPGTLWRYSGGGYTVMQQMLIDVLEQPFPEILRKRVLEPAGMADSTYAQPLPESRHAQASRAHLRNGKLVKGEWHTYPEMAAAGLWTTPTDLSRFAIAVMEAYHGRSDALLSRETIDEMLTEVDGGYGLGFRVVREGEKLRFSHGGSNAGFRCALIAWAHSGDGVALMTNGDLGSPLMTEILNSLAREYGWPDFSPEEKQVTSVPAGKLAEYAGTYKLKPAGTLTISVEDGRVFAERLYVIPEGMRKVEIFPESETHFFAVDTDAILTFQRDAAGDVSGLALKQGNRTREGTRVKEKK